MILQNHARLVGTTSQSQSVSIMVRYGDLLLKFGPNQQHVILLQHLIPGFVPAAHVTDEEVAKVLLTKYQSLCPSSSPMELEREINRWRHRWTDIDQDDKPQTAISALNNTESFPNIRNFLLLFVTLPITSCEPERVFSKGPRQPSDFILVIHKQFTCFF